MLEALAQLATLVLSYALAVAFVLVHDSVNRSIAPEQN